MLTTYVFYLPFSLFLSRRADRAEKERQASSTSYWLQPVLMYLAVAAGVILVNVSGASADVALAEGKVWTSGDIYGASTLVTIFTTGFIGLPALVSLYQMRRAGA